MNYVLYNRDGMGGFVVEAGLVKAGLPHEIVPIDVKAGQHLTPEFEAINPMRQVPALILPDGTLMTETAAIAIHLVDAAPDAGLGPRPGGTDHARFLRWMVFMSANVYEADLRYYYSDRYTDDPDGADGIARAAKAKMSEGFGMLDDALRANRGVLVGDALGLADVYLAMLSAWFPGDHGYEAVSAVKAQVAADPDYGPLWQRHFGAR